MPAPYISLAPLVAWREGTRPVDWERVFGRSAPLELEIGCGNGEVLTRRALEAPERNHIGLDHGWPSIRRSLRRLNLAGAENARLVQADAAMALERLFRPGALSAASCYFPRPWPRPKDQPRRLFSRRFLRLLNNRTAQGGQVSLLTDFRPFLDWVLTQTPDSGWDTDWETVPPGLDSKYERKWMQQGLEEFFQLTLFKTRHEAWPEIREPKLHYPWLDDFDPTKLAPFEHLGDISVMCKDVLYDPERERAMLRMVALEDGLEQAFYLEVLPQEGRHRVRPAPGCGVLPSLGVQLAMKLVAQRLAG